jgi:hypothetical protein
MYKSTLLAEYTVSCSAVWGLHNMWQCSWSLESLQYQPEEEPEKEEDVAEHKAAFLDALKRLKAARKYMC